MVAGLRELSEQVGHGKLEARIVVDQVYAHYQEVDESLDHPRGGQAHALGETIIGGQGKAMRTLAERAITPDGSELVSAAIDVTDGWVREYEQRAPKEFLDLSRSGHPIVTDDGETVYDKAPAVARLSEEELKRKHDLGHPHGRGPVPKNVLDEIKRQRRVTRRANRRAR